MDLHKKHKLDKNKMETKEEIKEDPEAGDEDESSFTVIFYQQ